MIKRGSGILKLALFATGLSGIVAEYVLSTLATYFLGDSVFQWTMIVSIMLFSMGLGSRFSKSINGNLLLTFIIIEFLLSLTTAYCTVITYSVFSLFEENALIIYSLSILIGIMIGMEIPLVMRINESFEELKVNVSSVMEKDYYGSLVGGMFFAFIGLPYLGLTYTPFILGIINFSVAVLLIYMLSQSMDSSLRKGLLVASISVFSLLAFGVYAGGEIVEEGEEARYRDPVVYSYQSKYQKIVITKNRDHFWLFINGNQQLSSLDETMYHEPLVHPAMALASKPKKVLIMGGGDGGAVREVLKYSTVDSIHLVDLDPEMTRLGKENMLLVQMNDSSMWNKKLKIFNEDGFQYLSEKRRFYDLIIIDLPDPKTVELGRLYSREFYQLCYSNLNKNGILVTQAGSPYYAEEAFLCIDKTFQAAGFSTIGMHNQVTTLGEWGWILGAKSETEESLRNKLINTDFSQVNTQWINNEAMSHMINFGKSIFPFDSAKIKVNQIHDPVLYKYYLDGHWDLY